MKVLGREVIRQGVGFGAAAVIAATGLSGVAEGNEEARGAVAKSYRVLRKAFG